MPKIKLISSDDQEFEVDEQIMQMSDTINNMLGNTGNPQIPLPEIKGLIVEKVIKYCSYHHEHPTANSVYKDDDKRIDNLIPWDLEFCNVDTTTLFDLIVAANFLGIKPLLDLCCKAVARLIQGKTPEQIRNAFNLNTEFTPEEEEQIRMENEWCEER